MNPSDKIFSVGLAILAAALPFSIAITSLVYYPLLVLWILGAVWTFQRHPPRWGAVEKAFLVFFLVGVLSSLCGINRLHSFHELHKDSYFLVYGLTVAWATRRALADRLLRVFVGSSVTAAVLGVIQYLIGVNSTDSHGGDLLHLPSAMAHWPRSIIEKFTMVNGRVEGTLSHPLFYAEILLFALALCAGVLTQRDGPLPWKWMASFWALCVGLGLSQSRGPWMAAGAILCLALILARSWRHRRRLIVVLLPALLLAWVPGLHARFQSIFSAQPRSNEERLQMWRAGWHIFIQHPLLGIGPGNVKIASLPFETPEELRWGAWGHLHSVYVNFAAERGLLGLLCFFALIGAFSGQMVAVTRRAREDPETQGLLIGSFLGLVGFLVSGVTETDYNTAQVLTTFYFVMGAALAHDEGDRNVSH